MSRSTPDPHPLSLIERSLALVCRNIFGESSNILVVGRFELLRTLGHGGTGVVYEAFDPLYRERVALKTVKSTGPAGAQRLKREFRSLAEFSHPNLVALHELAIADDEAYFTMELVDGRDFVSYAREGTPRGERLVNEKRLVHVLAQLCDGVEFLHAHDKLHRDIKPSNVLVTTQGRVVLLDFGLVHEIGSEATKGEGTHGYMAPEQAGGGACKASDWYSVGVMLREALYEDREPPGAADGEPRSRSPLELLSDRLIHPDPERRPGGAEIAAALRAEDAQSPESRRAPNTETGAFMGREAELSRLREAFEVSRRRSSAALVRGDSGVGKSALLREFAKRVLVPAGALVLSGRSYERESVPYKAFDAVIDELCQKLRSAPPPVQTPLNHADAAAVLQLFPVFGQVKWLREQAAAGPPVHPVALRERGFAALRTLFAALSRERPVALFLDDSQWADTDSGSLLAALLCAADSPRMLVVLGDRTDPRLTSPLVHEFRRIAQLSERPVDIAETEVGPLNDADAAALVAACLGDSPAAAFCGEIVVEARGIPLFLIELSRWARERWDSQGHDTLPSLSNLFEDQRARLSPSADRLLQLLAAAGRPLSAEVLGRAARARSAPLADLKALRSARLVSTVRRGQGELFEVAHDRIGESILRLAGDERRVELHRVLAEAIEQLEGADSEALVEQYLGANMRQKAADCARRAADGALVALAFSRAAALYERALALATPGTFDPGVVHRDLAVALEHSGQGQAAAAAYERAAAGTADPIVAAGLRHRAVQLLMHNGRYKEGEALLALVYRALGLRWPESPAALLASIAFLALPKAVRMRARELQPPSEAVGLARVEYLFGAGRAIINFDPLRAVHNALVWADQSDRLEDPVWHTRARGARAEALAYVLPGGYDARVLAALQGACEMARDMGDTRALADLERQRAFAHFFRGEPGACLDAANRSEACLRSLPLPDTDLHPVMALKASALYVLGRLREGRRCSMSYCHEARFHQDLLSWTWVHGHISRFPLLFSVNDRAEVEAVLEKQAWFRQHHPDGVMLVWLHAMCRIEYQMYFGTPAGALRAMQEEEKLLFGFGYNLLKELSRLERLRVLIRAAAALPRGARSQRQRLLAQARQNVIARPQPGSYLQYGLYQLHNVGILVQEGRHDRALVDLERARSNLEASGALLSASMAAYFHGYLLGGEQGREERARALRHLDSEGVVSPERYMAFYSPGILPEGG